MYRTAYPVNSFLTQMMNNYNVSPHSVAAFYTGCAELLPLLGMNGLETPSNSAEILTLEKHLKPSIWSNATNSQTDDHPKSLITSNYVKGVKRQLDLGSPSCSTSPNLENNSNRGKNVLKRRSNFDVDSSYDQDNVLSHVQPPPKRALLKTPPPIPEAPSPTHLCGNEWDHLSEEIWQKFINCRQTEEVFSKKMRLRDAIFHILQETYPYCGLYVVGSSMNGFGSNSSDMDMCLMLTHTEIDQKNEATYILEQIMKTLNKQDFIQKLELIKAKVPILKFQDRVSGVEVDFNVNNAVGIRNTHLLKCYSKLDWRVCPLILIIKMWARQQDINDAKSMTISSYSIVLMVIHYLQYGVVPAVLPCLHKLYPHKFLMNSDVRRLTLNEELSPFCSQNKMTLGELLIGFLNYYTNCFDFQEDAISVRTGTKIRKFVAQNQRSKKNNPRQWKCLCIEEPFDLTNTARSVYDDEVFNRVKMVFKNSWHRLKNTKHLSSILDD